MDASNLFINAISHWRDNKGIGTALIPPPLNDKAMVLGVLQRIYSKTNNTITLIVVNNFNERTELIEYLTNQEDKDNNEEFKKLITNKNIKIFTNNFIESDKFNIRPNVMIVYHCEEIGNNLFRLLSQTRFRLVVLSNLKLSAEDINKLYSVCPLLSDFKQNEIDELRTSTPVEEMRISVEVPTDSEDAKLIAYYDEYITTSINIFGSFDNIQYARVGDHRANLSATQFCYNLALENGWSENLDMSIELNLQIDTLYNPASIRERALQTYEMIRKRNTFLANYDAKLDEVLKIVRENEDKHILIISKFSEFAAKITQFINDMSEREICGNYHDRVDNIPASTVDGTPIYIKSGPQKGERRMFAAKAQKTLNEQRFNLGYINVLSTNNSPNKELCIPIDIIIITSPLCEEIESYIYRLSNIEYPSGIIKLYTLYIKDSIEEKRVLSKTISQTHILADNEQKIEKIDENFDFVVAD